MAQSKSTIDALLLSNEFKAEQRAQLQELPMSTVAELTNLLNAVTLEDPKTVRLFEFLVVKAKQFERDLPPAVRESAIRALKAKTDGSAGESKEYRASLLKTLEQNNSVKNQAAIDPPEVAELPARAATPAPATPVPTATPVAASAPITPVAKTPAVPVERESPMWPWLGGIAALIVIVAVALKRRA